MGIPQEVRDKIHRNILVKEDVVLLDCCHRWAERAVRTAL